MFATFTTADLDQQKSVRRWKRLSPICRTTVLREDSTWRIHYFISVKNPVESPAFSLANCPADRPSFIASMDQNFHSGLSIRVQIKRLAGMIYIVPLFFCFSRARCVHAEHAVPCNPYLPSSQPHVEMPENQVTAQSPRFTSIKATGNQKRQASVGIDIRKTSTPCKDIDIL